MKEITTAAESTLGTALAIQAVFGSFSFSSSAADVEMDSGVPTMAVDVTETTAASGSFSFSSSVADAETDAADVISTEDLIFRFAPAGISDDISAYT